MKCCIKIRANLYRTEMNIVMQNSIVAIKSNKKNEKKYFTSRHSTHAGTFY